MFGVDDVVKDLEEEIKGLRKDVQEIRDILKLLMEKRTPHPYSLKISTNEKDTGRSED